MIPAERSRSLWRRQAVLTILVALAFPAVAAITWFASRAVDLELTRAQLAIQPGNHRLLIVGAVATALALLALLGAVCLHAYQIAALTFRRGDTN